MTLSSLPMLMLEPIVRAALLEDLGRAGDLTTDSIVPAALRAETALVARQPGIVAGLDAAALAFRLVDPAIEVVVCGSCTPTLSSYLEWDRKILEHCNESVDYISMHRYVGNENDNTPDFLAIGNSIARAFSLVGALACSCSEASKP